MGEPLNKAEFYTNVGGMNSKVSPYANGPTEFRDLVNVDFITPGALTKRHGSTFYTGATVVGKITGLYEYEKLNGSSFIVFTANTNAFFLQGGTLPTSFRTNLTNAANSDFETFVDNLFVCNGSQFFKWDGTNASNFSLPHGTGLTAVQGASHASGFTGTFLLQYGYLNTRGFFGGVGSGITLSAASATSVILSGFTVPTGFGITSMVLYSSSPNGSDLFFTANIPIGTATFVVNGFSLGTREAPPYLWFTLVPKYMEIYNNQLFMAGFTGQESTVWFSDIAEPEGVEITSNFEVRTNDGDKLTGLKSYASALMMFKEKSFHSLTGDSVNNFLNKQVSDEYGCLSNRAIAVWNDNLWFLDRKGLVEFNGANVQIKSTRVEPVFLSMNIEASKDNALAIHNRIRNEIWFSVPCNGATFNNCTVVYDYSVDSFTRFEGFRPSSLYYMGGTFNSQRAFYGGYSGSLHSFFPDAFGDNGNAMTLLIFTKYHSDLGDSVTKQWRRFYANVQPQSANSTLTIRMFTNMGNSLAATRYVLQDPFQTRVDFGIPSKGLAFEISNNTNTDFVRFEGYSIEYRLQRLT